uniref:Uncharacterized protein n=1 Tax=Glossina austeni TaxID=7395 RepID=A0A1A9VXE0_GLOAU
MPKDGFPASLNTYSNTYLFIKRSLARSSGRHMPRKALYSQVSGQTHSVGETQEPPRQFHSLQKPTQLGKPVSGSICRIWPDSQLHIFGPTQTPWPQDCSQTGSHSMELPLRKR